MMDAATLKSRAGAFQTELNLVKKRLAPDFPWYPYGTLSNFVHLEPILAKFPLDGLTGRGRIADIGAADGDLAFFLERLGCDAEIIDHAPTNFNTLRGARLLAEHLASKVVIHDIDLDSYFTLPQQAYDLVFFLGILYHLKNPFYVLEKLAGMSRHLLVSTRIARYAPRGERMHGIPVAYLVSPTETNNDSTNYWIFSDAGLRRLLDRTGWDVLAFRTVGDTRRSEPGRQDRDERAFALLRSRTA